MLGLENTTVLILRLFSSSTYVYRLTLQRIPAHCCELLIQQKVNCILYQRFMLWDWNQVAQLQSLHGDYLRLGRVRKSQSAILKHISFLKTPCLVRAEVGPPVGWDSSAPERHLLWHNFPRAYSVIEAQVLN